MKDILRQYAKAKASLQSERVEILARLQDSNAALGVEAVLGVGEFPNPLPKAAGIRRGPGRPKKIQSLIAPANSPVVTRGSGRPKGKKGGMSAAGRARIIAGIKARWAKVRAAKAGK